MAIMTAHFQCGILSLGELRDAVSEAKFNGHQIEIWEGSGWLSRKVTIRGDEAIVRKIYNWAGEHDRSNGKTEVA
jgi:hypothetical protein